MKAIKLLGILAVLMATTIALALAQDEDPFSATLDPDDPGTLVGADMVCTNSFDVAHHAVSMPSANPNTWGTTGTLSQELAITHCGGWNVVCKSLPISGKMAKAAPPQWLKQLTNPMLSTITNGPNAAGDFYVSGAGTVVGYGPGNQCNFDAKYSQLFDYADLPGGYGILLGYTLNPTV
jgi:hypothetical protein